MDHIGYFALSATMTESFLMFHIEADVMDDIIPFKKEF